MSQTDEFSRAQALIEKLPSDELELLRGLVAGESLAVIAARLKIAVAEAVATKESLMTALGAQVTADAVRIGIYAAL